MPEQKCLSMIMPKNENVEEMKRSLKEDIVKTLLEPLRQASENKPAANEAEKDEKLALSEKVFFTSPSLKQLVTKDT